MTWNPPALVLLGCAAAGILAWLAFAPPNRRAPGRSALRLAAAFFLLAALFDVGCRRAGVGTAPRLLILVDRSLSMEIAGAEGPTRAEAARAWLASDAFAAWSAGWRIERDSFGGAQTDLHAALTSGAAELPDAVLVVSDGRAAAGRAAEAVGVPLFAHAPGPLVLVDAAIVDLTVSTPEEGRSQAVAEVAAVGGLDVPVARDVVFEMDGRAVGRVPLGRLAAGERQTARVPLPPGGGTARIVTARLVPAAAPGDARQAESLDAVAANDTRSAVWRDDGAPPRLLVVGLRAGWEYAAYRRALGSAFPGRVDAYWLSPTGLRLVDSAAGSVAWSRVPTGAYAAAYFFGNPTLLGADGRQWVSRFLGAGGRGVYWGPEGYGGEVPGSGVTLAGGEGVTGPPLLTPAGSDWLAAHGAPASVAPAGGSTWPPLEQIPAAAIVPPEGATVLLSVGGRPAAWVTQPGTSRVIVALGTGYYRWPLARVGGGEGGAGSTFWDTWSGTIARWLAAAAPAAHPLVRMPPGSRLAQSEPLVAEATGTAGLTWRITAADDPDEAVASGRLPAAPVPTGEDAGLRAVRAGPFAPGRYLLTAASADGTHRAREPFIVEAWAPDLAWTAADTTSLGAAARGSGGVLFAGAPRTALPPRHQAASVLAGAGAASSRTAGAPWAALLAALCVLGDWAVAGRRRLD